MWLRKGGTVVSLRTGDISVELDRGGDRNFSKAGMVDWLGLPVFVVFGNRRFHFDVEGRVQRIDGLKGYPWDWLQRTMANDWIYYDKVWEPHTLPEPSGLIGDWYWTVNGRTDLPMLRGHGGVDRACSREAFQAFDTLIDSLQELVKRRPEVRLDSREPAEREDCLRLWQFLEKAARNDRAELQRVANRLHAIHGRMAVLPPDTIEVDYRVLLVKLMDGCPNRCGFCAVRGDAEFAVRDKADIDRQIEAVADVYGADLYNHNSVVFGECDALVSPHLEHAANRAFETFKCGASYHAGSNLFMFTTAATLHDQPDSAFHMLDALPFSKVYINVGWEAASEAALARLQKQQTAQDVLLSLEKAGKINRTYEKVCISGNFIVADGFECESIARAVQNAGFSGQLYLSPLLGQCSSEQAVNDLQSIRRGCSQVRAHLYTMQRM